MTDQATGPPPNRPAHNMKSTPASGRLTRSRAETRGHGGFLELACAHLNHAACNLHGLVAKPRLRQAQPSRIFAKQHRFTDLRRGSLVATAIAMVLQVPLHGKKKPVRAKHIPFPASSVSPEGRFCVFRGKKKSPSQVDSTWVKQRASQPQNHSPCPRASVHSVLTGRRPAVRHAPKAARVHRAPNTLYPLAHTLKYISCRQNNVSILLKFAIIQYEHHPLLPSPR